MFSFFVPRMIFVTNMDTYTSSEIKLGVVESNSERVSYIYLYDHAHNIFLTYVETEASCLRVVNFGKLISGNKRG